MLTKDLYLCRPVGAVEGGIADFSTRGAAKRWSWALWVPLGLALSQVDAVAMEWMGIASILMQR